MRRIKTYIILCGLLVSFLYSNAYDLNIQGFVYDRASGYPVVNQTIVISIDSTPQGYSGYSNTVSTGIDGMYTDIIQIPDSIYGYVLISTDSCFNYTTKQIWFSINSSLVFNDFQVCDDNPGGLCAAYFIYYPIGEELAIQFLDQSMGSIENWTWNFGDGSTSNEPNPIHFYPNEGSYLTSLLIEGDSCYSIYETLVYVTNDTTNNCEALFFYENSMDPLTIEFFDYSIGNISSWQWDFGDGNYSSAQNPIHTYESPGYYQTELSIQTIDSCISSYSDIIWVIGDTIDCEAAFSYSLDTLNNVPNTFLFNDESLGDIQEWYWDFGDGNFSLQQSPTHVYENTGTYNVCLIVSSMQPGAICSSTICKTITTLEYYNFGGQAFIGDYPINIDSTENSNNAIVYLYRKISNNWYFMDYKEFWKYGYYWFADKPEGDYLLFAELLPGSEVYSEYAPAYFPDALSWKQAEVLQLNNNEQFAVNINFNELTDYVHGTGSITGYVFEGETCTSASNFDVSNILVQLLNSKSEIIAFTYTNDAGYYSFTGLGTENYILHAEYTGRYSEKYYVSLNEENPLADDINLIVHCTHILGIEDLERNLNFVVSEPKPNPASHKITLGITSSTQSKINIEIINMGGIIMYHANEQLFIGNNEYNYGIDKLPQGYYLIIIKDENTGLQSFKKLAIIK